MKILIADDHSIFRQGLRALLERDNALQIVAETGNGLDAIQLAERLRPDLAIIDIEMPGLNGLEACYQIRKKAPITSVIILSMHTNDVFVKQALKNGAGGYVVKDSAYDELKLAIEAVSNQTPYISPRVLGGVLDEFLSISNDELTQSLSIREREVFHLSVNGHQRRQIATLLHISPKTVDRHKSSIKEKLSLETDADLVRLAYTLGIVK